MRGRPAQCLPTHEETETRRGEVTPCRSGGMRRRVFAAAQPGAVGRKAGRARRWGRGELGRAEEPAARREKAEQSAAPGAMEVELSAEGPRGPLGLTTQACPLSSVVQPIISTAPGRSSRGCVCDDGIFRRTEGK